MKRVCLTGLLLLQGWAGACSPIPPSAEFLKAREQLSALKSSSCTAPALPRSLTSCTTYAARPGQVIPLLTVIYSAKVQQNAAGWTLSGEDGTVTVQVRDSGADTRVLWQRSIPVKEQLSMDLYRAMTIHQQQQNVWQQLIQLFSPPTCQSLGMTDTAWYSIERCRFVPQRSEPDSTLNRLPYIEISLRSAADSTVPLHQPQRFGYTGYSCQQYNFF